MQKLGATSLLESGDGWRRVIIEKPFGHDETSARALDRQLLAVISEEQLYRIDHYLGKETVQNMLVFRFANPGFEPIWNRNYIDHVQIAAAPVCPFTYVLASGCRANLRRSLCILSRRRT